MTGGVTKEQLSPLAWAPNEVKNHNHHESATHADAISSRERKNCCCGQNRPRREAHYKSAAWNHGAASACKCCQIQTLTLKGSACVKNMTSPQQGKIRTRPSWKSKSRSGSTRNPSTISRRFPKTPEFPIKAWLTCICGIAQHHTASSILIGLECLGCRVAAVKRYIATPKNSIKHSLTDFSRLLKESLMYITELITELQLKLVQYGDILVITKIIIIHTWSWNRTWSRCKNAAPRG